MLDIKIRVGSTIDTLQTVSVHEPTVIDGEHFKGTLDIRIKGLNRPEYFETNPNLFCIHLHGRFLTNNTNDNNDDDGNDDDYDDNGGSTTTADDILFGNQFDHPLQLPFGFSILTRFAQWWDPGLELHLDEEQPYAYSPLIVTLNKLHITNDTDYAICEPSAERDLEENVALILPDKPTSSSNQRQAYFNHVNHRQQIKVKSDQIWIGDFYNGYLDIMNGTIQIPGFSINALNYYNNQPLRFICKNRDDSIVYFIIEFDLSSPS